MRRRLSIGRLMAEMVPIAIGLTLVRPWLASTWRFAELGPMAFLALFGVSVAIVAGGRIRRFCLVAVGVGVLLSVGFYLCPESVRYAVKSWLIWPVLKWFLGPIPTGAVGLSSLQKELIRELLGKSGFAWRTWTVLGLLETLVAVTVGILAILPWHRWQVRDSEHSSVGQASACRSNRPPAG